MKPMQKQSNLRKPIGNELIIGKHIKPQARGKKIEKLPVIHLKGHPLMEIFAGICEKINEIIERLNED